MFKKGIKNQTMPLELQVLTEHENNTTGNQIPSVVKVFGIFQMFSLRRKKY